MTTSVKTDKKSANNDKYKVGDLVYASKGKSIYMLVPKDNCLPRRVGRGTLKGVCVWSAGGRDGYGDVLPEVGYFHNNLGENHLTPFYGTIKLEAGELL